ncbi:MAG: EAL domain-containing protein, partial [Xanthobacteraceae bacterium]
MMRTSTIFVAICMVLIVGSLGAALHAATDLGASQSAIVALAALAVMILYHAVAMRLSDRPRFSEQIADLSQGTADLARQVGEFGRRLNAIEGRLVSANTASQDRVRALREEISELGDLVNQLAGAVAAHDDVLMDEVEAAAASSAHAPSGHNKTPAPVPPAPPL